MTATPGYPAPVAPVAPAPVAPAPVPAVAPVAAAPAPVAQAMPYENLCQLVGQVCPNSFDQRDATGFMWKGTKPGFLQINFKMVRTWQQNNQPRRKVLYVKLLVNGDLGRNMMSQLRPGMVLRVTGEYDLNIWRPQGATESKKTPQFRIAQQQGAACPIVIMGDWPIEVETPRAAAPAPGGYPAPVVAPAPGGYPAPVVAQAPVGYPAPAPAPVAPFYPAPAPVAPVAPAPVYAGQPIAAPIPLAPAPVAPTAPVAAVPGQPAGQVPPPMAVPAPVVVAPAPVAVAPVAVAPAPVGAAPVPAPAQPGFTAPAPSDDIPF